MDLAVRESTCIRRKGNSNRLVSDSENMTFSESVLGCLWIQVD